MNNNTTDASQVACQSQEVLTKLQPLADIIEIESEFQIIANFAGVKEEDLNISIENDYLVVTGKITSGTTMKKFDCYERQFHLGEYVNTEGIKATFDGGVLYLILPKKEATIPQRIHIAIN